MMYIPKRYARLLQAQKNTNERRESRKKLILVLQDPTKAEHKRALDYFDLVIECKLLAQKFSKLVALHNKVQDKFMVRVGEIASERNNLSMDLRKIFEEHKIGKMPKEVEQKCFALFRRIQILDRKEIRLRKTVSTKFTTFDIEESNYKSTFNRKIALVQLLPEYGLDLLAATLAADRN